MRNAALMMFESSGGTMTRDVDQDELSKVIGGLWPG